MDQVDEDGSGQIEFTEFLHIIKKASHERAKREKTLQKVDLIQKAQQRVSYSYSLIAETRFETTFSDKFQPDNSEGQW